MLSDYELHIVKKLLTLTTKLKYVEIQLPKNLNKVRLVQKDGKIHWIGIIGLITSILNLTICSIRFLTTDSMSIKAMNAFFVICSFAAMSFRTTNMTYQNELVYLVNNIFVIGQHWQDLPEDQGVLNKQGHRRGQLLVFFSIILVANSIAVALQTVIANYTMFPDSLDRVMYFAFLIVYVTFLIYDCATGAIIFTASIVTQVTWLRKACLKWPGTLDTWTTDCVRVYRTIQLVANLHNSIFGTYVVPATKLGVVLGIFVTAFCLVRVRSALSPFIYTLFFLYLFFLVLIIFPGALLMSMVFNISSKFHRNIKSQKQNVREQRYLEKALRSIPVLKCSVGGVYHMEGEAKLTLLDNIARGVAFTLLTHA